ncbi:hypothetical protein AURDEDRAFT_116086 [Auricularia subglabra TFB-10046 SS5]|uniref:Uncharacterized protein n=1 Tax=Auricularia subglabra (strain TFB-10046 / SS5) TaxID=717982 RepID=J0D1A1_AURST|nr:hypothetical protein AURDEDRAFT_116086 [Auricularia subglabra TFB-10046 SS5]
MWFLYRLRDPVQDAPTDAVWMTAPTAVGQLSGQGHPSRIDVLIVKQFEVIWQSHVS